MEFFQLWGKQIPFGNDRKKGKDKGNGNDNGNVIGDGSRNRNAWG